MSTANTDSADLEPGSSRYVTFTVDKHVATVTLNRPEKVNAITYEMDEALAQAWKQIDRDPTIRVAVLTGAGERGFCAGGDLDETTRPSRLAVGGGLTGVGGPLVTLRKPLVAVVHGYVLGGGFELAMCADVIVAAEDTEFALPEVRSGFVGESGVVHRTMRQLPYRAALELILLGGRLSAADAARYALVNQVVPRASLQEAGREWAERLSELSPLAVQALKEAATASVDTTLADALARRVAGIERYASTRDAHEARQARAERRAAVWTGT